jgi:hypothetical protein
LKPPPAERLRRTYLHLLHSCAHQQNPIYIGFSPLRSRRTILWAVRWYCRYGVSYRDLEEMLTQRGMAVDHTTVYRWVQR